MGFLPQVLADETPSDAAATLPWSVSMAFRTDLVAAIVWLAKS